MSYATLITSEESIKSNYLAILQPRRRIQDWSLFSGFVYSVNYDLGDIVSVVEDGITLTEGSSASLSAGFWYYDESTEILYIRTTQSADPDTVNIVVTYSMYMATIDSYFNSDPLDTNSEVVYFDPLIVDSPLIRSSTSDSLFGALPVYNSSIILANAEHFFERHIYRSSFNQAVIKIYHYLDELVTDNVSLVFDGLMSNLEYETDKIKITIVDRVDEFTKEYRNLDTSFFNTTDFPNVDPTYIGKPIRYVYGYVKGFKPVNVDYVAENPTTSDNRDWVVMNEQTGIAEVVRTVQPSSTTTRTYLDFCEGLQVGDTVFLDRVSGSDEYKEITVVSYSPAYIEHSALASPMASGDSVKKGFVSSVTVIRNDVSYQCLYGRDYTVNLAMAAGCSGFSFTTSMEANVGLPSPSLSTTDIVIATIYGRANDLQASMATFGANDYITNNLANPVMVLYDLLKTRLGLGESKINLTQFATVRTSTATQGIGLVIPENGTSPMPSYKSLILKILETSLLRIFIDDNLKWTIAELSPLTTPVREIDSQEIYNNSFNYTFDYKETISDVIVEYAAQEYSPETKSKKTYKATAMSEIAKYTHKIDKQKTFHSLHFRETDAQQSADRLSFALGDRIGTITFSTTKKFFPSIINNTVSIMREKLPDFVFISGTNRTVEASVVDITRGLNKITIRLEDQKGIEDNSGSW